MSEAKINLRPDSYAEGGGLIDDFDGTITDFRFIMTDYEGAMADAVPVAKVTFDVEGEESVQLYSVGGKNDFAPNDTGFGLVSLKGKTALTKTAKYSMLMDSFVKAGFPMNKMDPDDMQYMVGLRGHFLRQAVDYKGLEKKKDRDNTVLLCTKIETLPWDAKSGGGKKSSGKGKAAAKDVDDDLADATAGIIQGIVIENDGEVAKKNMLTAFIKAAKDSDVDQKKALKLANDDTWLNGRDEWAMEDGVLKLA